MLCRNWANTHHVPFDPPEKTAVFKIPLPRDNSSTIRVLRRPHPKMCHLLRTYGIDDGVDDRWLTCYSRCFTTSRSAFYGKPASYEHFFLHGTFALRTVFKRVGMPALEFVVHLWWLVNVLSVLTVMVVAVVFNYSYMPEQASSKQLYSKRP